MAVPNWLGRAASISMIWSLFERVERTGRLVGEQQPALADDGSGDGDALLLTTGEVVGVAVEVVGQAERVQRRDRSLPRLACIAAVELERQHHVLDGGQRRHEVEPLEHVADVATAQRRQLLGGQVAEVAAVDTDLAGARRFEAAGEMEQRRLAATGGPHHGEQLAWRDREVDAAQGVDLGLAAAERLDDVDEFEDRVWSSRLPFGRARRDSQRSSQRRSASARTTRASETRAAARSSRSSCVVAALAAAQLEEGEEGGAVAGDHVEGVLGAVLDRHQHLQHQLVARRRVVDRHGLPPRAELFPAGGGELVRLLPVVLGDGDETVALETFERRVDLPDVERPDAAGGLFELGLQLIAVAPPVVEQGKQSFTHSHWLPSMHTR